MALTLGNPGDSYYRGAVQGAGLERMGYELSAAREADAQARLANRANADASRVMQGAFAEQPNPYDGAAFQLPEGFLDTIAPLEEGVPASANAAAINAAKSFTDNTTRAGLRTLPPMTHNTDATKTGVNSRIASESAARFARENSAMDGALIPPGALEEPPPPRVQPATTQRPVRQPATRNTAQPTVARANIRDDGTLTSEDAASVLRQFYPNIVITGGRRTEAENAALPGSAENSRHIVGHALDLRLNQFPATAETKQQLESMLGVTLSEFGEHNGTHLHIAWGTDARGAARSSTTTQVSYDPAAGEGVENIAEPLWRDIVSQPAGSQGFNVETLRNQINVAQQRGQAAARNGNVEEADRQYVAYVEGMARLHTEEALQALWTFSNGHNASGINRSLSVFLGQRAQVVQIPEGRRGAGSFVIAVQRPDSTISYSEPMTGAEFRNRVLSLTNRAYYEAMTHANMEAQSKIAEGQVQLDRERINQEGAANVARINQIGNLAVAGINNEGANARAQQGTPRVTPLGDGVNAVVTWPDGRMQVIRIGDIPAPNTNGNGTTPGVTYLPQVGLQLGGR